MLVAVEPSIKRSVTIGVQRPRGVELHEFKAKQLTEAIDFINSLESPTILGYLGGPGQYFLIRLRQECAHPTYRVPFHALNEHMGDAAVGADVQTRTEMLVDCFMQAPEVFYEMGELDFDIFYAREFARARLAVQDHRKRAQLQYMAAERDLELALGIAYQASKARKILSNPGMISGAKADEKALEAQIVKCLGRIVIYDLLRNHPVLPQVKGLGPALGGGIIGEILDIRRFSTPQQLRAYARYTQGREGGIPRRRRGEVANWSDKLHRPVWLWSTDQVTRYDHVWRDVYRSFKLDEFLTHPEIEVVVRQDAQGRDKKVRRFTAGHLNRRAQRRVGSALLEYVHALWWAVARGDDPVAWYQASEWPAFFAQHTSRINDEGGLEQLNALVAARKGETPDDELEDESGDDSGI
ncbi:hypothetical protein IT415_02220 [bacterium]|nr:hypothetical protein [bacterium]